jgi:hypothetical protein
VPRAPLPGDTIWYQSPFHDDHGVPNIRVWKRAAGEYFLCTADGVGFTVDPHGREVRVSWTRRQALEDVIEYLLRLMFTFVHLLNGTSCLHASAVAVDARAVAILGPSGAGKSTIAAAFAARGCPLIADDMTTLMERDGSFWAQPATSHIRLWPESIEFLFGQPDALPRFVPDWDKRRLDLLEKNFPVQDRPLPLAAIYLLEARSSAADAPTLTRAPFCEALIRMIAQTHLNLMMGPAMSARAFAFLGRLAAHVPIRVLTPHQSIDRLPRLLDLLVSDLQAVPVAA